MERDKIVTLFAHPQECNQSCHPLKMFITHLNYHIFSAFMFQGGPTAHQTASESGISSKFTQAFVVFGCMYTYVRNLFKRDSRSSSVSCISGNEMLSSII